MQKIEKCDIIKVINKLFLLGKNMQKAKDDRDLEIIGNAEYISIDGQERIPAKIDTGADSTSVWASNIEVKEDQKLYFTLFSKKSSLYTGKVLKREDYKVAIIRSSNGTEQIRYRVILPLKIRERTIRASVTLTDRSKNWFPVIIGRKTIANRFLVDTSKTAIPRPPRNPSSGSLNKKMKENPYKFHQEYIKKFKKQ